MQELILDQSLFKSEDEAVEYYFQYYRKNGYPNYNISDYSPEVELQRLVRFDDSSIRVGQDLKQTMHSCGYLWCFFPHWVEVETWNDKSLIENWNDDEKLRSLIRKTIRWNNKHNEGLWTTNRIRQNAKVYCSKQTVSNFRPTVAKYIYNTYGNKGAVYDPCAGWGGRMFGFIASDCKEYECCDASIKTCCGLTDLSVLYSDDIHKEGKQITIVHDGSENYAPQTNHFDLAFTSPPYFDTEHYEGSKYQSYVQYPTYDEWKHGFLEKMIHNVYACLKPHGYFVLNIAKTSNAPTMEDDAVQFALSQGFTHVETLYLVLSSIAGKGIKREPVFVFRK